MTTSSTVPPRDHTLRPGDSFLHTTPLDPLAETLLAALEREYDERYSTLRVDAAHEEITRFSADAFTAPQGTFLLLVRGGVAISGGAFMTVNESMVEFKRVWTDVNFRGQGLARLVLKELETEALRRGFTEVVLSTGPRQPEAVRLYFATGYEAQFDRTLDPETIGAHTFRKHLHAEL